MFFILRRKHYDNSKNKQKKKKKGKIGRNDIFDEIALESTVAAGVLVKDKRVFGDAAALACLPAPPSPDT